MDFELLNRGMERERQGRQLEMIMMAHGRAVGRAERRVPSLPLCAPNRPALRVCPGLSAGATPQLGLEVQATHTMLLHCGYRAEVARLVWIIPSLCRG